MKGMHDSAGVNGGQIARTSMSDVPPTAPADEGRSFTCEPSSDGRWEKLPLTRSDTAPEAVPLNCNHCGRDDAALIAAAL